MDLGEKTFGEKDFGEISYIQNVLSEKFWTYISDVLLGDMFSQKGG